MRDFDHYMEEKSMILVFVSTYSCQHCDEDRWYLHKVIYNFLLRKDVGGRWDALISSFSFSRQ